MHPVSARLEAVRAQKQALLDTAAWYGAHGLGLCGSVARGEDTDASDIDFYVRDFEGPDGPEERLRANDLVKAFRELLTPFRVDIRGIPGYPLDPPFEASMQRDWRDLHDV